MFTSPLPSTFTRVAAIALGLGLGACDVEPESDTERELEQAAINPDDIVPPDEATFAGRPPLAITQDTTENIARAPVSDGADDPQLRAFMDGVPGMVRWQPVHADEPSNEALARFAAARPDPDESFSYVGMVTPRGHYLIEVEDEAMMLVHERVEMIAEGGQAGPDYQEPLPEDQDEFRGWSNGYDSRERLTGASIPPMVGVVWGAGQCSGALIGRRIVRTAAHCLIHNTTTGGWAVGSATFHYRRDAGSVPVSTSTSSYYYGGAYLPSGCGTSSAINTWAGYGANHDACTWADWAYLILPTDWSGGTWHSWFGYKTLAGGDIDMELQSGGYPGCGLPESPASCVDQAYYRDASYPCSVSAWTNGTAKFRSGCDISPGNSGGPVWEEGTPYLIGHAQWQDCGTCQGGYHPAPNHYLGHDDWLFNFQNNLRSWFP